VKPEVFKLEALFAEYEHAPGMLVLGASDAASPTADELFDLCGTALDFRHTRLSYSDAQGDPLLRQAIASTYPAGLVSADDVIVTIGGSEAIFLAVQALLNPGDVALVCAPAYQALASIAVAIPASVESYAYAESRGQFAPDLEALMARIGQHPRPALLIVNTPHNPTGNVIPEQPLRALLAAAANAGTAVLVDEVFSGIWYGDTPPVPSAITIDRTATVIGSLSKVYGLSGLRIGWLVGARSLIERCTSLRHYTTLTPPVIVQELAALALQNKDKLLDRTRRIAEQNRTRAVAWLRERQHQFDWIEPQGGLLMLVRLKARVNTEALVRDLADVEKVSIVPCPTTFDMREGYVRIGLGTDPTRFAEGLKRIDRYLMSDRWKAFEQPPI
jgi:aspartate/methionine/tyrosine aminotransferase